MDNRPNNLRRVLLSFGALGLLGLLLVASAQVASPRLISSYHLNPSPIRPGRPYTVRVETSPEVNQVAVLVDYRPYSLLRTRLVLAFDPADGAWKASAVVPADIPAPPGAKVLASAYAYTAGGSHDTAAWNHPLALNSPPTASAGRDRSADHGTRIILDGTASSDPDGDSLSYSWRLVELPFGSGAQLLDSATAKPSFTIDRLGKYVVELRVSDGLVESVPSRVTIDSVNAAPVANAGPDQSAPVGSTVVLDGAKSSDANGDSLNFAWTLTSRPPTSQADLSDPNAVKTSLTLDAPGKYEAALVVFDGFEFSGPDSVVVSTVNTRPVANAGPDQSARVNDRVTLDGSKSSDVDGDPLTWSWSLSRPQGSTAQLSDSSAVHPAFTVDVPGVYVAQLIVNDGHEPSLPSTVTISHLNSKPLANAGPDQKAVISQIVRLDGSQSSDADHDALQYSWSLSTKPDGSTAQLSDSTGVQPQFQVDKHGDYVGQLMVYDGQEWSGPDTVTISTLNSKPLANAGPDKTVAVGDRVTLDGTGSSDADHDPLDFFWSFTKKPDASNSELSDFAAAQPTFLADRAGDYILQLIVGDGIEKSVPDTVTINAKESVVEVPNLVGSAEAGAAAALSARGLLGSQTAAFDDSVAAGIVVSQDPVAGTKVAIGSSVAYVVSKGPAPRTLTITPSTFDLFINASKDFNVALDRVAPPGGTVVTLSSSSDLVSVPKSLTINAGQMQAGFTATAGAKAGLVTVSASALGVTPGTTKITVIDNVPPDVTLQLVPASDTPPVGDGITEINPVSFSGKTEPGLQVKLRKGTVNGTLLSTTQADANGAFTFTGITLSPGPNILFATAADAAANMGSTSVNVQLELCPLALLSDWSIFISDPSTLVPSPVPGKVTANGCGVTLSEGDSFRVSLERVFILRDTPLHQNALHLFLDNGSPSFDGSTTNSIRDAFELAIVALDGSPLVYTIDPNSDACLNFTDGQAPALAAGVISLPATPGHGPEFRVNLAHLFPGQSFKLILRLLNNDRDRMTTVRLNDLRLEYVEGLQPAALSESVAQVSKPAVSRVSKPANSQFNSTFTLNPLPIASRASQPAASRISQPASGTAALPTGKSAARQIGKSALLAQGLNTTSEPGQAVKRSLQRGGFAPNGNGAVALDLSTSSIDPLGPVITIEQPADGFSAPVGTPVPISGTAVARGLLKDQNPGLALSYPDFKQAAGLTLNGDAKLTETDDGSVLRLTPASSSHSGSVFSSTRLSAAAFSSSFSFRITNPNGTTAWGEPGLVRELYSGIPGLTIADLTNAPAFVNHQPTSIEVLRTSFEAPQNVADNYGQRIYGLVIPPITGNYTFWLSGDDQCQLYLSTTEQPEDRQLIASVNTWTFPREWTKEPNQRSSCISLVAGQRYYIEALMKEGFGGDSLSVRWQLPDGSIEEPIPVGSTSMDLTPPLATAGILLGTNGTSVDLGVSYNHIMGESAAYPTNYVLSTGTLESFHWFPESRSALLRVAGISGTTVTLTVKNVADQGGVQVVQTNFALSIPANLRWGVVGASELNLGNAVVPVGNGDFNLYSDSIAQWATYDELVFIYEPLTGDFDRKVRVDFQEASGRWARAGLCVREALNLGVDRATQGSGAASRFIDCHATPVRQYDCEAALNSWEVNMRLQTGGAASQAGTGGTPRYPNTWCRIQRQGNTFRAYRSDDGVNWTLLAEVTPSQPFPSTVYVGPEFAPENANISDPARRRTWFAQLREYGPTSVPAVGAVIPPVQTRLVNQAPGADGIAFVIQSISSSVGTGGGGLGYGGIQNSVAVEFDTWWNPENNDPDSNHLGIDTNGSLNHGSPPAFTKRIAPAFDNGQRWYAWVDYDGANLEVRLNQKLSRPATPSLTRAINIPSTIHSSDAYIGFTSGTGGAWANHDILDWQFNDGFGPINPGSRIISLTIGGLPAESLDASGNFFSRYPMFPGQQELAILAIDDTGHSNSTVLHLTGTTTPPGAIDTTRLVDLTGSVLGEYGLTTAKDSRGLFTSGLALRNAGTYPFGAPLLVGITRLSDPTVRIVGVDGTTQDGIPYFNFVPASGEFLAPGALSAPRTLSFLNPNRVQFTYEFIVLGNLNQAPVIVSKPELEAITGRPYTYTLTAQDPDSDPMSLSAPLLPRGVHLSPVLTSGESVLTWTPGVSDLGAHDVLLRVSDNRGGTAEQRFTITVTAPPPNRPPVFVSTPVLDAHSGQNYIYNAQALDKDGDTITYQLLKGPGGMKTDATSGATTWAAPATLFADRGLDLQPVDFASLCNWDLAAATSTPTFPTGKVTANGVPFFIPPAGNNIWHSVAHPGANPRVLEVTVNRYGVVMVHSLINTFWGQPGPASYAAVEFIGDNGAFYRKELIGGSDIRDFLQNIFTNEINEDNTRKAFSSTSTSGRATRLDQQKFTLPAEFGRQKLARIRFIDNGSDGFQRIFLAGLTIAAVPTPVMLVPVALEANDGHGGTVQQSFDVTVLPDPSNHAPIFVSTPVTTTKAGKAYQYQAVALDADNETLHYGLASGPPGMTVDSDSGKVNWTPPNKVVSTDVALSVTDPRGGLNLQKFQITTFLPPDLVATRVDTSALVYDFQSLAVSGAISVTVSNQGEGDVTAPFDVTLFEARNLNQKLDSSLDAVLAQIRVKDPIVSGHAITITATATNSALFPNNSFWAWVDSHGEIDETAEDNNLTRSVTDCHRQPVVGQFNPVVKWTKSSFDKVPDSDQVLLTPVAMDLNGDGIPEIIFTTFPSTAIDVDVGILRALDGKTGGELWSVTNSDLGLAPPCGICVGDLDGDGKPDIVGIRGNGLVAFEADGRLKWRSSAPQGFADPSSWTYASPALADLDGDGLPEIVVGSSVFNHDGSPRWSGLAGHGAGYFGFGANSVVADLDLDGKPEIIAGNTAYRADGSIMWQSPTPDGFAAVARFGDDRLPEIVVSSSAGVYMLTATGAIKWSTQAAAGGPSTIADFDGDGTPEIGVAGHTKYVVLRSDGSVLWTQNIDDTSSGVTGSTVFDLDGDGKPEIIYGDQDYLRIFRGTDGAVLARFSKSSGTIFEMPIVVGAGPNGAAEIVAVANKLKLPPANETGILVIGDASDSWVPARKIWNQQSYHVGNVNDDGTIPTNELSSWLNHNTYRANLALPRASADLADLIACRAIAISSNASLILQTRVANRGSAAVPPGVSIAFYSGQPASGGKSLGTTSTTADLAPGAFEDVTLVLPTFASGELWVAADDDGTGRGSVAECDEQNNIYQSPLRLDALSRPPVFTSLPLTGAARNRLYQYVARATDPDSGDTVAYGLKQGPPGMSIDSRSGLVRWLPGDADMGKQAVQLLAFDNHGSASVQAYEVEVSDAGNSPPVFVTTPPSEVAIAGDTFRYAARAVDPDGESVEYNLSLGPPGMTVSSSLGVVAWTPGLQQLGKFDVILRARDPRGGVVLQPFSILVAAPNTAPSITSTPKGPALVGLPYQYQVTAQDTEKDPLTFSLTQSPSGMTIDPATGLIAWKPTLAQVGTQTIIVRVEDGRGGAAAQTFTLPVQEPVVPNDPPSISSNPRTTATVGLTYVYEIKASDPDNDPLTFKLTTAPAGMVLTNDPAAGPNVRLLQWTPTVSQVGSQTVRVDVSDGRGGSAWQPWSIQVGLEPPPNRPPEITTVPGFNGSTEDNLQQQLGKIFESFDSLWRWYLDGMPPITVEVTNSFTYFPKAVDPDGDPVKWSLVAGPVDMSVDPIFGTTIWKPDILSQTVWDYQNVTLQAEDPFGASTQQKFRIKLIITRGAPWFISVPPTTGSADFLYTYQAKATALNGASVTYSLTNSPAGMTIDSASGLVQWTPTADQAGTNPVTVVATDAFGTPGFQTYPLVIAGGRVNHQPIVTSLPPLVATVGSEYRYDIKAADPDGDTLRYTVGAVGLFGVPVRGITIDTQGVLRWTPDIDNAGIVEFTISVSDPHGSVWVQSYTVGVSLLNRPPAVTSTPAPSGYPYRYDVRAIDPDKDPLTYAVEGPPGMTIDTLGRIYWMPGAADVGTNRITVTVSDNRGASGKQIFELVVRSDNQPPSLQLTATPNPANIGDIVAIAALASDNLAVASVTLTFNGTPVLLDASGRANLKMTTAGFFDVKAVAKDIMGNSRDATLSLQVVDPTDIEAPVALISTPEEGAVVTSRVDVRGTASHNHLAYYTLSVAPAETGTFREVARGTTQVVDGVLGKFDPTLLENDSYILRLEVVSTTGKTSNYEVTVNPAGNLKLGNFRLSFTDLTIPVSGIPITVGRTYDSLTADSQGDFGYGWRLEFKNTQLRTSVPKSAFQEELIYSPFLNKSRVYITLPGGKREGFTFKPRPSGPAFLKIFYPEFVSDAGVYDTLTVGQYPIFFDKGSGQWIDYNLGTPYNPASPIYDNGIYTLTTKEGVKMAVDGNSGSLSTITDRNSNVLKFTEKGIQSSTGVQITVTRDPQGRIIGVTDPMGNTIRYAYDAKGDLVSVTDRMTNTTKFVYAASQPHYLSQIIDALGNTGVRTEYDEAGRLMTLRDAQGNPVNLVHDLEANTEQIIDQLGNVKSYQYDARGNITNEVDALGAMTQRTYDAADNLVSETDPLGRTWVFAFDSQGNMTTESDPLGHVTTCSFDASNNPLQIVDPKGNTTEFGYSSVGKPTYFRNSEGGLVTAEYDSAGNCISATDGLGNLARRTFDNSGRLSSVTDVLGRQIQFTFDVNGHPLTQQVIVTSNGVANPLIARNEYDAEGRPISQIDYSGRRWITEYNALGQKTKSIDPLGHTTTFSYTERGDLSAKTFPDGTRIRIAYDAARRPISVIDQGGATTRFVYDPVGRVVETILPDNTPGNDSDNPRRHTEYDSAGHVLSQTDERGNRTSMGYDDLGRVVAITNALGQETRLLLDELGQVAEQRDAIGRTTRFIYDSMRRLARVTFPDGTTRRVSYDLLGRLIEAVDQAGITNRFAYDTAGRLVAVMNASGFRTEYSYDERNKLTRIKDALGRETAFDYDERGLRTRVRLPLGQVSVASYDDAGNLGAMTDFNGRTIRYEYDARNRLVGKVLSDGTSVRWGYTPTGLKSSVVDYQGETLFDYDPRGRLLSKTQPDGVQIRYAYDDAGNRTSVTTPSRTLTYSYDNLNRLETVTDPLEGTTRYTYDAANNVTRLALPNQTYRVSHYDLMNRVTNIAHFGPEGLFADFAYSLNKTGQRQAAMEVLSLDGNTTRLARFFEYDLQHRLVRETYVQDGSTNRIISYALDAVGNRFTRSDSQAGVTSYAYDANDQLLSEVLSNNGVSSTNLFLYDANGNTLARSDKDNKALYGWDDDNRLRSVEIFTPAENLNLRYAYDPDGLRIASSQNGVQMRFIVDANRPFTQVLETQRSDGTVESSFITGLAPLFQADQGSKAWYHPDHLGSTRVLTDQNGKPTDAYLYDAFGRTLQHTGTRTSHFAFAGEERDAPTKLDYLRSRYLDVSSGRFLSRDSFEGRLTDPQSLHRYGYAKHDPINLVDPSGHESSMAEVSVAVGISSVLDQIINNAGVIAGWLQNGPPDEYEVGGYIAMEGVGQRLLEMNGIYADDPALNMSGLLGLSISLEPRKKHGSFAAWSLAEIVGEIIPGLHSHPLEYGVFEEWLWDDPHATPPLGLFTAGGLDIGGRIISYVQQQGKSGFLFGTSSATGFSAFLLGDINGPTGKMLFDYPDRPLSRDSMAYLAASYHAVVNWYQLLRSPEEAALEAEFLAIGASINGMFSIYWVNKTYGVPRK